MPNSFPFSLPFRAPSAANLLLTIQLVRVVRPLLPAKFRSRLCRRERPRSCWHRLREDSLVRHPFAFCAKGGSHPMWRGHSCPRDPIPDDVGESVLARAPLTIVILEEAESCDSRRMTYAFPGYPACSGEIWCRASRERHDF